MLTILNEPKSEYNYEFQVVMPTADPDIFVWLGNFENWNDEAEKLCRECNGVVFHNVRIAHKELKEKK